MINIPDQTKYAITKFISKVYTAMGQKKTADVAICRMVDKFLCCVNLRSEKVMDMNGLEYPTTGRHNMCCRVAVLSTGSSTTDLFIYGGTEMETAIRASESATKSLCRQIGEIGGFVQVYYTILGTYDFDNKVFTPQAVDTETSDLLLPI